MFLPMNVMKSCCQLLSGLALTAALAACSAVEDDSLPPCPQGLDLSFTYSYNTERADMFRDHVGAVTVYLYDGEGKFLKDTLVTNTAAAAPLKAADYHLYWPLPVGQYQYVAVARQRAESIVSAKGADTFSTPQPQKGDDIKSLLTTLAHADAPLTATGDADLDGRYAVRNQGLPLDTLWHGMDTDPARTPRRPKAVSVAFEKVTKDTVQLVRDTKYISIALRNVDAKAEPLEAADYDYRILDKGNDRLAWDNELASTTPLLYTPYVTWTTSDRIGQTQALHADFMTSRLIWHDDLHDDAVLSIRNKRTGQETVRINLPDYLSQGRIAPDYLLSGWSQQEYLDREYKYSLTFYLVGGSWKYVELRVGVLSWAKRIQREDL